MNSSIEDEEIKQVKTTYEKVRKIDSKIYTHYRFKELSGNLLSRSIIFELKEGNQERRQLQEDLRRLKTVTNVEEELI